MKTIQQFLTGVPWESIAPYVRSSKLQSRCRRLYTTARNSKRVIRNKGHVVFGEQLPSWDPSKKKPDLLIRAYDVEAATCDELYGHDWETILGWLLSDHTRNSFSPSLLASAILKEAELSEPDENSSQLYNSGPASFSFFTPSSFRSVGSLLDTREQRHLQNTLAGNRALTEKHIRIILQELQGEK